MRLGLPATVVATSSSSGCIRWSCHGDRIIRNGELVYEAGVRCSLNT